MMNEEKDKRRRERVPFEIHAEFTSVDGQLIKGTLHDLSMSGFFLKGEPLCEVGSRGTIKILLVLGLQKISIEADCVVARVVDSTESRGLALQIAKIDTDSSIHLYNIIKFQKLEN